MDSCSQSIYDLGCSLEFSVWLIKIKCNEIIPASIVFNFLIRPVSYLITVLPYLLLCKQVIPHPYSVVIKSCNTRQKRKKKKRFAPYTEEQSHKGSFRFHKTQRHNTKWLFKLFFAKGLGFKVPIMSNLSIFSFHSAFHSINFCEKNFQSIWLKRNSFYWNF